MSEFLTSAAKSDIRVVVKNIVTNMQKIKMLREDITEASKGVAEKYEGEITAQDIKTMARLEYDKENDVFHGFRTCADVHLVWRSAQGSISGQGFS